MDRRVAHRAGGLETLQVRGRERTRVEEEGGGRYVGAAGQDPADLVEGRVPGEVGHAVGAEGEELVDVACGEHTARPAPGQDRRVDTVLVGGVDLGAHQLHVGTVEHGAYGLDPLVAGGPLDDPIAHVRPFRRQVIRSLRIVRPGAGRRETGRTRVIHRTPGCDYFT